MRGDLPTHGASHHLHRLQDTVRRRKVRRHAHEMRRLITESATKPDLLPALHAKLLAGLESTRIQNGRQVRRDVIKPRRVQICHRLLKRVPLHEGLRIRHKPLGRRLKRHEAAARLLRPLRLLLLLRLVARTATDYGAPRQHNARRESGGEAEGEGGAVHIRPPAS